MVIVLLSMGENLEIEVYLLWPALVILGIHARELADEKAAKRAERRLELSAQPA